MSPRSASLPDAMERCDWSNLHQLFMPDGPDITTELAIEPDVSVIEAIVNLLPGSTRQANAERFGLHGLALDNEEGAIPPDESLREWIAHRLPLTDQGRLAVTVAPSWAQLYSAMFADPEFGKRLASALDRRPPTGTSRAIARDIECIYELFLGRSPEFDPHANQLEGLRLEEVLLQVLSSAEFHDYTLLRVFSCSSALPSWDVETLEKLAAWATRRLWLSPETGELALTARTRQALLFTILTDRLLCAKLGRAFMREDGSLKPVPLNIQLMIVEATMLFEHDRYLSEYINVAASGGHPLHHYLHHGIAEGTNPNRMFDTRWYLSAYPDVRREPVTPLVHYILVGAALGFKPHPFFPGPLDRTNDAPLSTPLGDYLHGVGTACDIEPVFSRYDLHKATEANYLELLRESLQAHIEAMVIRPEFFVYDPDGSLGGPAGLSGQIYRGFRVAETMSSLREGVDSVSADRSVGIVWLESGDVLADNALYEFAARLNADPLANLVYGDQEIRSPNGRSRPFHKPDWSPDYLEGCNYIGSGACVFGRHALDYLAEASSQYDWILRSTDRPSCRVSHVRKILVSTPHDIEAPSPSRSAQGVEALKGRLSRTGRDGSPKPIGPNALAYHMRVTLKRAPLVSIVIPTAAKTVNYEGRRIDLIVNCLSAIDATTTYDNIEYVIVDNGDLDRLKLDNVVSRPIHYLTYEDQTVNIARKINLGGQKASGDYILILNDDIVPLDPDWITNMIAHFEKPNVGLVGARLLYPSGLVQHSGMVSNDGVPLHVDRFAIGDEPGYFFGRVIARNFLAVTGAVTMVSREIFEQVGGYDETFPIDFNDVDFAYRIGAEGYRIIYEPGAKLIHYESVSAVKPPRPWDRSNFEKRWAHVSVDPFYNEYCLTKHSATSKIIYSEKRH